MKIEDIYYYDIIPNPDQPRKTFNKTAINELANSINMHGLMNPITVCSYIMPSGEKKYKIIAGERRWRAIGLLCWKSVPCIIDVDENIRIKALIENIHRKDLSHFEKGDAILAVFREHGISDDAYTIAKEINVLATRGRRKSVPSDGTNYLKICKKMTVNPNSARNWLQASAVAISVRNAEKLQPSVAGATLSRLATIRDEKLQRDVHKHIIKHNLNKDRASRLITKVNKDGYLTTSHQRREKMIEEEYVDQLWHIEDDVDQQIPCEVGIIDIKTDNQIIEVKTRLTRATLFQAIGQVVHNGCNQVG